MRELILLDPGDTMVLPFDWTEHLSDGVAISTSSFVLRGIRPRPLPITSITRTSATATVTTSAAHGLSTNDWVSIAGADQSAYNVTAQVTVVTSTTFTFAVSGSPTTPATGTITYAPGLGQDNASILSAAPYNSQYTQVRLVADAVVGYLFEVSNVIVTNESPAQTRERSIFVLIEGQ